MAAIANFVGLWSFSRTLRPQVFTFTATAPGADEVLPPGYLTQAYSNVWTFNVPTTITLTSGSLPPGLSLVTVSSTQVEITGTPTVLGNYTFTLAGFAVGAIVHHITVLDSPDQGGSFVSGI